jgi:hypothetical protein
MHHGSAGLDEIASPMRCRVGKGVLLRAVPTRRFTLGAHITSGFGQIIAGRVGTARALKVAPPALIVVRAHLLPTLHSMCAVTHVAARQVRTAE